ncbi:unnamed protein product [Cylicostephanus goldi]|uniref:Uncharacterized protein n=1 Tax=Cylicostephanus goldi TaxID=71465 RepID=A0A3P6T7R8_CYLGO|nr:unnamed protein product [Cylicostephanus goldi]
MLTLQLYGANPQGYAGQRAEWAKHVRFNGTYRGMCLQNWVLIAPGTDDGKRLSAEFIRAFFGSISYIMNLEYFQLCIIL